MNKKDYAKAREYFQRTYNAQEKYHALQKKDPANFAYPGNWVPNITSRIEQLDKLIEESKQASSP